jgi:HTH-type transcriptional regulator / antitoxin HigA
MDDIRPIETESDYDWALTEIARYFEREPAVGTPDSARLKVLLGLVAHYESRHWPIEAPDPVEAIRSMIGSGLRSQADLAEVLGSRSRASEVLSRKRPLTLEMMRKLHVAWKLPADLLIRPYAVAADTTSAKRRAGRLGSRRPGKARGAA